MKNTLKSTVQTLEKEIQTDLTSEDINQKDLKIEELRQKLGKQEKLKIITNPRQINLNLKDSSWIDLSTEWILIIGLIFLVFWLWRKKNK